MTEEKLYMFMDDTHNVSVDNLPPLSPEMEAELEKKILQIDREVFGDEAPTIQMATPSSRA